MDYDSSIIRSPALRELSELWHYRDLLKLLIANSIKTRYKRSVLGVVWSLLNPLLNTLVISIALSFFLRFEVKNYVVYLLIGLIFWNFFAQTTVQGMNTLIWGSGLIKRIYIPRTIFAVSGLGNGLVNLLLSLVPLALIMLAMRQPFTLVLFFLPLPILLMAMFTLGIALLISALAVFFVDVVDIYNVSLSALFYLTPVIYPISIVPEKYAQILKWNPLNIMLDMFRSIIYYGEIPSVSRLAFTSVISLVTLGLGWLLFTKKVDELAYHI
jgi:ABC-type polysaccharide/polyol phosphate export permease